MNEERIRFFLQDWVAINELKMISFCDHHHTKAKERRGGRQTHLRYNNIPGEGDILKARNLVVKMSDTGYLADLVFDLTDWWITDDLGGEASILLEEKLHEDLCSAAQELWEKGERRAPASEAFDHLAVIHEDFRREWKSAKAALTKAPSLGPEKSVVELVAHLASCRERYEQAIAHYEQQDWLEAKKIFVELNNLQPGYSDVLKWVKRIDKDIAKCEDLYKKATVYREAHQWVKARATYIELDNLQPGYSDVLKWVKRLRNEAEVQRLQKVMDAAESGFVYEDQGPPAKDHPYRLFKELRGSITPGSSIDEAQKERQRLEKQEPVSEEQRAILESLESEEQRLFVDAFLYPDCPSQQTAIRLEALFLKAKGRLPEPKVIIKESSQTAEVTLLLLGHPEEASARWKELQRNRPRAGGLAHSQGLLYLGRAYDDNAQDLETVVENWRRAISHWAIALADESYWRGWGKERCEAYDRPFLDAHISTLRVMLQTHLADQLQTRRRQEEKAGNTVGAEAFAHLYQDLAIEFTVVRLSQDLGGMAVEPGKRAWFGPLGMAHFGWEKPLAEYLATVVLDDSLAARLPGALSPTEILRRLRWYFSHLRTAAFLLEGSPPDPRRALKARDEAKDHQAPAYAGMEPSRAKDQEQEDRQHLALEAHLLLAYAQMERGEIKNPETLEAEWREALRLGADEEEKAKIREKIRAMVLAKTAQLAQASGMKPLDAAIGLLELCRNTLSDQDQTLNTRLAEVLAGRSAIKQRAKNLSGAQEDLKRAHAYASHIADIRKQLATIWLIQAIEMAPDNRFLALDLLRQAQELLHKGMESGYDFGPTLKIIEETRKSLSLTADEGPVTGDPYESLKQTLDEEPTSEKIQLYSKGIREMREGNPERALETLSRALEKAPDDPELQRAVALAVLAKAARLIDKDEHEAGIKEVMSWQSQLPTQENLPDQLEFLRQWPELKKYLEVTKITHKVHDYQEVLIPFGSRHVGTLLVRLQVTDDALCLRAPLPFFSGTQEEKILGNLLKASREIMLFRVSATEGPDLELRGLVPFRLLNTAWFLRICFSISLFADIPPDKLDPFEVLRGWFRETRTDFAREISLADKDLGLRDWFREKLPASARDIDLATGHHVAISSDSFEAYCKDQKLKPQRLKKGHYRLKVPFGQEEKGVEMEAWPGGVRLSTRLGLPPKGRSRPKFLRQLVKLNASLKLGKLALAEDQTVILSVELPYLKQEEVGRAFEALTIHAAELEPKLELKEEAGHAQGS